MRLDSEAEPRDRSTGISAMRLSCPQLAPVAHTWWCRLTSGPIDLDRAMTWLSPAERVRSARFGTARLRERYIIGRATLRLLLSSVLGTDPANVPIERGHRGRPQLSGEPRLDFNVSHTGEMAVFVIATAAGLNVRLGIDIELPDRELGVDRLARKLMTDPERRILRNLTPAAARQSFLRTWTCKEAMSKATGDGLAAPFGQISVHPGDVDQPRLLDGPAPYQPDRWALHRIATPVPSFVTVAVHTT